MVTPGPTDRDLVITGKSFGTSNILIFDQSGELMSNLIVTVGPPVNLMRIYSRVGNLNAYGAYNCNSVRCVKVKDEGEGYERIPQGPYGPYGPYAPGAQPTPGAQSGAQPAITPEP
jgi:putative type II/III system pilus formation protein